MCSSCQEWIIYTMDALNKVKMNLFFQIDCNKWWELFSNMIFPKNWWIQHLLCCSPLKVSNFLIFLLLIVAKFSNHLGIFVADSCRHMHVRRRGSIGRISFVIGRLQPFMSWMWLFRLPYSSYHDEDLYHTCPADHRCSAVEVHSFPPSRFQKFLKISKFLKMPKFQLILSSLEKYYHIPSML